MERNHSLMKPNEVEQDRLNWWDKDWMVENKTTTSALCSLEAHTTQPDRAGRFFPFYWCTQILILENEESRFRREIFPNVRIRNFDNISMLLSNDPTACRSDHTEYTFVFTKSARGKKMRVNLFKLERRVFRMRFHAWDAARNKRVHVYIEKTM